MAVSSVKEGRPPFFQFELLCTDKTVISLISSSVTFISASTWLEDFVDNAGYSVTKPPKATFNLVQECDHHRS